jgi:predicted phosphodiesterase
MVKIMLVGDMHGDDPTGRILIEQKESGIDKVAFLGDYDTPEVLRSIRKLKIPKILVIGNHDYGYVKKWDDIGPNRMYSRKGYFEEWENSIDESQLVLNAANGFIKNEKDNEKVGLFVDEEINGRKIGYVHGSITDLGNIIQPDIASYLQTRLMKWNTYEKKLTFKKMREFNYHILFRGHDSSPQILSQSINLPLDFRDAEEAYGTVKLDKNRRYVINPGIFVSDYPNPSCWAIFDSSASTITFKDLR